MIGCSAISILNLHFPQKIGILNFICELTLDAIIIFPLTYYNETVVFFAVHNAFDKPSARSYILKDKITFTFLSFFSRMESVTWFLLPYFFLPWFWSEVVQFVHTH